VIKFIEKKRLTSGAADLENSGRNSNTHLRNPQPRILEDLRPIRASETIPDAPTHCCPPTTANLPPLPIRLPTPADAPPLTMAAAAAAPAYGAAKLNGNTRAAQAVQRDLTGQFALVTGGNSGIGVETVAALAGAGADVVLCSRSAAAGEAAAAEIRARAGTRGAITVRTLDLASLADVERLAAEVLQDTPRLDMLICNAGESAVSFSDALTHTAPRAPTHQPSARAAARPRAQASWPATRPRPPTAWRCSSAQTTSATSCSRSASSRSSRRAAPLPTPRASSSSPRSGTACTASAPTASTSTTWPTRRAPTPSGAPTARRSSPTRSSRECGSALGRTAKKKENANPSNEPANQPATRRASPKPQRRLELAAREEGRGVVAFAVHPGVIATNLARHMGWVGGPLNALLGLFARVPFVKDAKTIPQGAATSVLAATAPAGALPSGAYLADCGVAEPAPMARDAALANALWEKTEAMIADAAARRAAAAPQ
jgi:NAD(P)-dependent dehydrogenase (short-subunit alcohol dehydrogenase family)